MTKLFLLTHGIWGPALKEAAESIVGTLAEVQCYPLLPDDALATYIDNIEKSLPSNNDVLLLTDLRGGSTTNVAAIFCQKYGLKALTGLDLNMLIAADNQRQTKQGEELVDAILEDSKTSVIKIHHLFGRKRGEK